jgi:pyridinium-3,5-biscarboxylic acid mononucleotide synthase
MVNYVWLEGFPDASFLRTSISYTRFVISVNYHSDEQLELLNLLFQEESSQQPARGNERRNRQPSHASGQTSQDARRNDASPGLEVRSDTGREQRKGTPEVIFGETKEVAQIIAMAQELLKESGRAIVSRIRPEAIAPLQVAFQEYTVCVHESARSMVIYKPDFVQPRSGGHVGVISAGTSDIPVAEEAALIASEMGCRVTRIYDVGVAGLHRLVEPLRNLLSDNVDAIIVAAGMDGALPSVVTGIVPVPVIGLPTSIGYGFGGKGIAALLSMLQTCAPGLSVVNIDNGVGAGITAALIANRVAQAREH